MPDEIYELQAKIEDSIPKSAIREKIEEIKKHRDLTPFGVGKLEVLQEILEEGEKQNEKYRFF